MRTVWIGIQSLGHAHNKCVTDRLHPQIFTHSQSITHTNFGVALHSLNDRRCWRQTISIETPMVIRASESRIGLQMTEYELLESIAVKRPSGIFVSARVTCVRTYVRCARARVRNNNKLTISPRCLQRCV